MDLCTDREIIALISLGLVLWFISGVASLTNPYNTCINDCKRINTEKFSYYDKCEKLIPTCYEGCNDTTSPCNKPANCIYEKYDCIKVDSEKLDNLCWKECKPHETEFPVNSSKAEFT